MVNLAHTKSIAKFILHSIVVGFFRSAENRLLVRKTAVYVEMVLWPEFPSKRHGLDGNSS